MGCQSTWLRAACLHGKSDHLRFMMSEKVLSVRGRTKRDNLILRLNRPIIPKNNS